MARMATMTGRAVGDVLPMGLHACRLFGTEVRRYTTEDYFADLLGEWGIANYRRRYRVRFAQRMVEMDVAFLDAKVDVEVDDYTHQHSTSRAVRDQERDALLAAEGWTVLRFTGRDIHHRKKFCKRALEAALRRARRSKTLDTVKKPML